MNYEPDIKIVAGLKGGGSLSGTSGKLIQDQLNSIASQISAKGGLKIKVDVQNGQNKQRITALQQAKIATEEATRAEKLRALQVKTSAAEDSRLAAELKRAAAAQKVAASETDKQTKADAQANIVREKALATLKLMEAQFPKMKGTAYEAQFNAIKEGLDDQTMSGEEANAQLVTLRKNVAAAGLAGQTFGQKMSAAFAKFAQYVSVSTIILSTIRTIKQMVSNVTELDSAMVDLQIASGKSYDEVEKLIGSYHKLGQEMGATTTEVAKSADAWLRQGYNVSEASKLIKASMILAKLGQIESAEASKYLTSAMKGYKLSVDDAISVVDKLAATDMEAAVSAGGIATAMAETAVSADVAGISMDRLIGYIAKVAEVTQDGEESVGTFFKTLTARMGNVKANRLVDPETGDDISDVETVLRSYSIALRDTDSEFRNFGDVLDEVAANWDNYGSVAQHAIAVAFSGTRQQEKFLVLMENYQDAMRLAGVSADSAGTALEKYKVVQDGISARADALKSQWQELSSAIVDDNAIKSVISGGTSILNILTQIIQKLGLIPTLTIGLSAALGYKGNGIFTKDPREGAGGLFGLTRNWLNKDDISVLNEMSDRLAGMNKEMRESTLTSKEWAKEIDSLSPPLQRAAKQLKGANGEVDAFKGGLKGLKGVLSNVGNILINAAIGSLVSLALIGLEKLWNYWEDQKSYLKQLQTEYETLKGKVEALNTEYDTNSKRIEELIALKYGNGIAKSQQEELDLLNKQNEALELQILRQERLAQLAADKVRIQAEKTLSGASYNVFNTGDEGWDAFFSKVAGGAVDAEFALTGYAAQINKITSEINELNDAYANGGISEAEYTRELHRLKAEQDNWAAKSESLITDVESQISGLSDNDPLRVKYQELIDTLLEVTATYDKLRSAAGEFDPSKAKAELVSRFGGQGYISRGIFNNSLNKLSDEQLKFVVSIAPTITNRDDFLAAMRNVLDGGDSVVAQKYIEWQAIADKNAIKAKLEIDGSFADEVKKNLATLGSGADGILATSNLQALEKSGIGKDKIQAIGNLRILVNDLGYSWSAFVAAIKETEFALDDVKDAGISTISFLKAALNSTTSDTDLLRQSITALENDVADFDALFAADENGEREYFDALISKFPQLRGELELYSNGLISAEQLSKAFKSALAASDINALSDAFKNIRAAVEAYGADSYEAKQATEAVADTLPGLNGKLVDAAGNYTVLGEAAITAANGNVDAAKSLIEAEIAAQKLNLQHAIDEMGRVAKAAYGAKIAMGIMRAEMADTDSSDVDKAKSAIAELEEMLDGLNSGKYKLDDGSSKSSGSSTDAYLEKYKQDLADIQFLRDMDYISEKEYHDKLRALNDERLKGRNKYLDEYRANLVALHNYDVKLFEEAKDAQVDALEKEKDALEDYYNDLIDAKKKETEAYKKAEKDKYEAAKKRYENEKKLLQKELDGKKKAIQKQLDLLSDQSDEKSHEEEVAESNKRIADIRSKIEEKSLDDSAKGKAERLALEEELVKETSALEKSQYDWSVKTQRGALEKQMDQLEEYYDKLMENIDNALDHLEETFDVWLDNFETSIDSAIEDLTAKMEAAIASIDSQIQSVKSQTMAVSAPTAGTGGTGGDNSSEIVKQLQSLLQNNGFSVGKQGVDGKLGKDTIKALQRYLNSAIGSGLKIDGIIGSATTAAINDAINKRILSSMFSVITSSSFPKYHTGGIVGAGNKKDMDLLGQIVPIDRKEVLAKLMKNEAVLTEGQQNGLGNIVTNLMGIISRQNGVMRPALAGAYNANTSPTFNVTYNVSGDVSKTTIADLEATQKKFADYAINQLSNNVRRTLNRYGK